MKRFRSITAKIGSMRKAKSFVIYPSNSDGENKVKIQSDNRIAMVMMDTGMVVVSNGKGGHQGFDKLMPWNGAKHYECPQSVIDDINAFGEKQVGPVQITG